MSRRGFAGNPRPRLLDRRLVTLALRRGGMILYFKGAWVLYRSQDARRMQAGRVSDELAEELLRDGVVQCGEDRPVRLCAGPSAHLG